MVKLTFSTSYSIESTFMPLSIMWLSAYLNLLHREFSFILILTLEMAGITSTF